MNIVFRSINAYFVHHGNYFSVLNTNFLAVLYYYNYYYFITSYFAYLHTGFAHFVVVGT